ncbi:MAG: MarR family transcriptional regulator [Rhodospirillaceae bacterium]|nr:MAG: MarR family transcriptional regulator [Rhodospirillaceae bacterium]
MPASEETRDRTKLVDRATLSLLAVLENDEQLTQRGLASRIGVALGLTNSLLKRAAKKGLIKITQAPAKRFVYYITPKGFSEKSRLIGEYLSSSLDFFRQVREEYTVVFEDVKQHEHTRVALFGMSEIAEIAIISAQETEIDVLAIVQPASNQEQFSGLSVVSNLTAMQELDLSAIVITSADAPQEAYEMLREYFRDEQIFTVPLLHISRRLNGDAEK